MARGTIAKAPRRAPHYDVIWVCRACCVERIQAELAAAIERYAAEPTTQNFERRNWWQARSAEQPKFGSATSFGPYEQLSLSGGNQETYRETVAKAAARVCGDCEEWRRRRAMTPDELRADDARKRADAKAFRAMWPDD